ncbi:beta strand repeat-containing protein [Aquitalea magnusonii]|uniref:beta strand repeat-containing protein n=1 Tax=Aquitalea magnusonii TaxID=332411 RepID=UPI000ABE9454|nr:hypothetical protein [Aquitalea magnusonii]
MLTARDHIEASGQISADALEQGNGGSIKLLSQGNTTVSGSLSAKGGADTGNGGSIETSGSHVTVSDSASINTTAAHGKQGSWLIDPTDFTVAASGGDISGSTLSAQLNQSDVTLQTTAVGSSGLGDIIVNDALNWSSGYALNLTAYHNIYINQNISGNGANLNLNAGGGLVQVNAPLLDVTLPWSTGTLWFNGSTPQTLTSLTLTGGTATVDSTLGVSNYNQTGGTLNGAGTVTASNGFSWTGGEMSGAGTTVIDKGVADGIIGNPLVEFSANELLGRTLINLGSVTQLGTWNATGLALENNGLLYNQSVYRLNSLSNKAVIYQLQKEYSGSRGVVNSGVIQADGNYHPRPYVWYHSEINAPVTLIGGTLDVGLGDLTVTSLSTAASTISTITGGGTVYITSPNTNSSFLGGVALKSGATLNVNGGAVYLPGGSNIIGDESASISIWNGILSADGNINVGNLYQSGGALTGAGTTTVVNDFNWAEGTMSGSGTTVVGPKVSAGVIAAFDTLDRKLINQGNIVQSNQMSANWLSVGIGGQLINHGVYTLDSSQSSATISNSGSNLPILNTGTIQTTGINASIITVPLQMSGSGQLVNDSSQTLQIGNISTSGNTRFGGSGVIELTGPAALSGSTTVAAGSSLLVDASSSFSSSGSLNVQGNLQFNGNVTLNSDLQLQSGSLYLNGITLNENQGTFNWSGGAINGSGGLQFGSHGHFAFGGNGNRVLNAPNIAFTFTDLVLPSGSLTLQQGSLTLQTAAGDSVIPSGASLNVNGGVLTNNGPLSVGGALNVNGGVFAGTGTVSVDGGSLSINGGSWSNSGALSNTGTLNLGSGSYAGQINNQGTINTAGASFSQLFSNSGTLNLLSATSSFNGGLVQTGGVTKLGTDVSHPASMLVGGSGYQLNSGTLEGSGNINGNVSVSGGTLSPGYSPGSININGNLTLGAGSNTVIQIGGTTPGIGFDQITVSGTASLGGALTVSLWNGYSPATGSSYRFLQYGAVNGSFANISLPGSNSSLSNMAAYAQIGFAAAPNSFASMPAPVSMNMQDAWEQSVSLNRNVSVLSALATTQVLPMNLATDLPVFYDWSALSVALNCK